MTPRLAVLYFAEDFPMRGRFAEIFAAPPYGHKQVCASLPDGCTEVASAKDLRQWLRRIARESPRPLLADHSLLILPAHLVGDGHSKAVSPKGSRAYR